MEVEMANFVVWADLPVTDMARARAFYSKLLGYPIEEWPNTNGGLAMLMQPGGDMSDAGADLTVAGPTQPSSTQGAVVYFSANGDIDGMLERAVEAGGKVFKEKQDMGDMGGWLAYIIDSEGNLVGLQQPNK